MKIWDVAAARCVATLEGHSGYVLGLAVLDAGRLASASFDRTVKIWDVAAARCVATLEGHSGWVSALAVLDAGRLASGSADNSVKIWDVAAQQCEMTVSQILNRPSRQKRSRVRALAALDTGRLVSGDKTLKLWDLVAARRVATLEHARQ